MFKPVSRSTRSQFALEKLPKMSHIESGIYVLKLLSHVEGQNKVDKNISDTPKVLKSVHMIPKSRLEVLKTFNTLFCNSESAFHANFMILGILRI